MAWQLVKRRTLPFSGMLTLLASVVPAQTGSAHVWYTALAVSCRI